MLDFDQKQLQASLEYVQQLRGEVSNHSDPWGEIKTSHPDSVATVVQNAWLVIEVSTVKILSIFNAKMTSLSVVVCSRKPCAQEEIDR